jgi:hypothetical protein
MSSATVRVNTGQQITTDYELGKIFLWNNRYENDSYVNNSNYNPQTILAGTVMGRVTVTGFLQPSNAAAVDGSQRPIGILAQDIIGLASGSTRRASICVAGDVDANKCIFLFGDTMETVADGRRFRDRIQADSVGIKLIFGSTEMTDFDN